MLHRKSLKHHVLERPLNWTADAAKIRGGGLLPWDLRKGFSDAPAAHSITSSACGTSAWWGKRTKTIRKSLNEGEHLRAVAGIGPERAQWWKMESKRSNFPDFAQRLEGAVNVCHWSSSSRWMFSTCALLLVFSSAPCVCFVLFSLWQCFKDLGQSEKARKMCEAACSLTTTSKEVDCPSTPLLCSSSHILCFWCQQSTDVNEPEMPPCRRKRHERSCPHSAQRLDWWHQCLEELHFEIEIAL